MKKKLYTLYGNAFDKNGQKHVVTVVGLFEQFKEDVDVIKSVPVEVKNDSWTDGILIFNKKQKVRTFTTAYSICHPDDEFNDVVGIELAESRLKTRPIGQLSSVDVTMLTPDMCNMVLFNELTHIINNIDKYIG